MMTSGRLSLGICSALVVLTVNAVAQEYIPLPIPRPDRVPQVSHEVVAPLPRNRPIVTGTRITLADAVFMGLRNNRTIKSAYVDRIAEKFDLRVAEDRFTPQFGIEGTIARERIGDVGTTSIDVSPGVTILTPTGAAFNFAWSNTALLRDHFQNLTSVAEISLEQPLLRGAGIEVNMAPLQTARLGEQINRLKLGATVSETIGNIIFAHRDLLLAQEELKLADSAVERGSELLRVNQALIQAGRMAQMESVQTEADLESQKLRVLQVTQQVEAAKLALLDLLALDLSTPIVAAETLTPRQIPTDIDELLGIALRQRQDYLGQLYAVEQNRLGLVVATNEQLWDISLFARGRFGSSFFNGSSTENIGDIAAGLKFSFPLNDISRQQPAVQASTNYQGAELQLAEIRAGIEMQIRGSASEVSILWRQIAIAERSLALAQQALEVEKLKLNAGRSTTFQVRSLESSLRAAEVQLLTARIGYLNALTRLDLQLGTTLNTWQIALQE